MRILMWILSVSVLSLAGSVGALCQTYVYTDQFHFYDSLKVTLDNGRLVPGQSTLWSDAVLTVSENKIYKGNSTSGFDVLYTVEGGKVYSGDGTFLSDLLYTISNGKIYRGDSTFPLDCLYTYSIAESMIYTGNSTVVFDAVLFLQGEALHDTGFCAVLLALGLL